MDRCPVFKLGDGAKIDICVLGSQQDGTEV